MTKNNRVEIFDTTLRDGMQTPGLAADAYTRRELALLVDRLGVDHIEAGWPGAGNPAVDDFFKSPSETTAELVAFGMTKRSGRSAANDETLSAVLNAGTKSVCIVAKTDVDHVEQALGVTKEENLDLIRETVEHAVKLGKDVTIDCEHFFDGYKKDSDYAIQCVQTAIKAGAKRIVFCDTNGGSFPHEISQIVSGLVNVRQSMDGYKDTIFGIHTHNDRGLATANTLAAVAAGCRHVQGTVNGIGERTGNANLIEVIPNLIDMGFDCGRATDCVHELTHVSREVNRYLGLEDNPYASFVGRHAGAQKAGLHASAFVKNPDLYRFTDPTRFGNNERVTLSAQAGASNVYPFLQAVGLQLDKTNPKTKLRVIEILRQVGSAESNGYQLENAPQTAEVMCLKTLSRGGKLSRLFNLVVEHSLTNENRKNALGHMVTVNRAVITVLDQDHNEQMHVAEGNGPVDALDKAMRFNLEKEYPDLAGLSLEDFKVRIINHEGTESKTQVTIRSRNGSGDDIITQGVGPDIIEASKKALVHSYISYLVRHHPEVIKEINETYGVSEPTEPRQQMAASGARTAVAPK